MRGRPIGLDSGSPRCAASHRSSLPSALRAPAPIRWAPALRSRRAWSPPRTLAAAARAGAREGKRRAPEASRAGARAAAARATRARAAPRWAALRAPAAQHRRAALRTAGQWALEERRSAACPRREERPARTGEPLAAAAWPWPAPGETRATAEKEARADR